MVTPANHVILGRVVNGPTSSGLNPARTRKLIWSPNHARKNKMKVMLGLKHLAMLPSYFDYIFMHLRQKVRLRPELSPKFLSTLGPIPTRKARPNLYLWFPGRIYIARSPWYSWDYCNIFLPNIGEETKNKLQFDRRAPRTVPMKNPALVIALCS